MSRVGYVTMPLVISAINFKLSPTEKTMETRYYPLKYLGDLISSSSQVYEVSDFVSTKADDILHLVYITSQEVFLRQDPSLSPPTPIGPSIGMPSQNLHPQHSKPNAQLIPARVKSWHDAFLRHTRAYLLISTTVDYFMSVGQLPQNNILSQLVCSMPPFGNIQLPWSLGQHQLSCQTDTKPYSGPDKREYLVQKGFQSSLGVKDVENPLSIPTVSDPVAHKGLSQKCKISDHDPRAQHGQLNEREVDYLPSSHRFTSPPLPAISDPGALVYSPDFGCTLVTDTTMDRADLRDLTELSSSYDTYISGLFYECFGSTPMVNMWEVKLFAYEAPGANSLLQWSRWYKDAAYVDADRNQILSKSGDFSLLLSELFAPIRLWMLLVYTKS